MAVCRELNKNLFKIDALNLNYRDLNKIIKEFADSAADKISASSVRNDHNYNLIIKNVLGQRYIGDGIKGKISLKVYGTPGNDLAAFMDGPEIEVFGNCQDGVANTMNSGRLIIHGDCGDILGYSMRGGEIYVRGNVGWRSGIHMKSYMNKFPVIVIGGKSGNFLGEYMAGGIIIVLGEGSSGVSSGYSEKFYFSGDNSPIGGYACTGMHGGEVFIRGNIEESKLGKEVRKTPITDTDADLLEKYLKQFCRYFNKDFSEISGKKFNDFIKLLPHSHRPYGRLYAY